MPVYQQLMVVTLKLTAITLTLMIMTLKLAMWQRLKAELIIMKLE